MNCIICCIGDLHTVETRFYFMGFGFELDTTDFLYKECDMRMNRYNFFPKKTHYTRVIRNGLSWRRFAFFVGDFKRTPKVPGNCTVGVKSVGI